MSTSLELIRFSTSLRSSISSLNERSIAYDPRGCQGKRVGGIKLLLSMHDPVFDVLMTYHTVIMEYLSTLEELDIRYPCAKLVNYPCAKLVNRTCTTFPFLHFSSYLLKYIISS